MRSDRQSISIPIKGNRHRRLAGDVEQRSEGNEPGSAREAIKGIVLAGIERAERHGGFAERRRELADGMDAWRRSG